MSDKLALQVEDDRIARGSRIRDFLWGSLLSVCILTLPVGIGLGTYFGNAKGTWSTCGASTGNATRDTADSSLDEVSIEATRELFARLARFITLSSFEALF